MKDLMGQAKGKNKKAFQTKATVIGVIFVAVCLLALNSVPAGHDPSKAGHWYSIITPLLAVSLAILTGRILFSLATSILVGGFLVTVPGNWVSPVAYVDGVKKGLGFYWASLSDIYNLQILGFVVFMMAMIVVLIRNGGLHGVVNWVSKFAKTRKSARIATAFMGIAIFIDDYANTMLLGSSMRPLTDQHKVSREKLAFIVDATAAPVTGMALVSTWIGYVVGLFGESSKTLGLGMDGYEIFLEVVLLRFYCVMMVVFVFLNVLSSRDFGPMRMAEDRAARTGKVHRDDAELLIGDEVDNAKPFSKAKIRAKSALIPLGGLLVVLFGGLWIDGGGMQLIAQNSIFTLLNPLSWKHALIQSENNLLILAWGAFVGLVLSLAFGLFVANVPVGPMWKATRAGLKSSILPCLILLSAWSLKATCDALMTGPFLVAAVGDVFSPTVYPGIVFVLAAFTAFSTGTSWATMAILIPTAVPIAFGLDGQVFGTCTLVTMAAILDGAILGDHCSPISDTTIMSSIGSGCDHIDHVKTQLPYALLVGFFALFLGFMPAAFDVSPVIAYLLAIPGMIFAFFFFSSKKRRRTSSAVAGAG